jgi:TolB-like protein
MKRMIRPILVTSVCMFLLCAASGCSDLNGTRLEPVLGDDVNLVRLGNKVAEALINQTQPPLFPNQPDGPIMVTTLVNNDNLDDSSSFGRSFQNNIAAGFVSRGFIVREINLRRELRVVVNKGEFMLTRDMKNLASKQRAQAVVVGTYTMANRVMYLSVRLVNPVTQGIMAAYEDKLYLDANSLKMLGLKFNTKAADASAEQVQPPSPSLLDKMLY